MVTYLEAVIKKLLVMFCPIYDASDVQRGLEEELLIEWWKAVAALEEDIPAPGESTNKKLWAPNFIQQALRFISRTKYLGDVTEKIVIFMVKQVAAYLEKPEIRTEILERIKVCVEEHQPTVLVGHSLGSIACYESLCAHPEWPVKVFVTLGSPLGINRLIFEKLQPKPIDGVGFRPQGIESWINIADKGDIVALIKDLDPMFAGLIHDESIDNGFGAHNASRYLTTVQAGNAIKLGL